MTTTEYELTPVTKSLYQDDLSPSTKGSAGIDLRSASDLVIEPNKTELVPTGLKVALSAGCFGMVSLRSSLGLKGLRLANGIGVIDEDYRGEILMAIHNQGTDPKVVSRGDRLGQIIVLEHSTKPFIGVESLDETERGSGGFGSTGR